jgi:hypothetical protein
MIAMGYKVMFSKIEVEITYAEERTIPVKRNQSGLFLIRRATIFGNEKTTEDLSACAFPSQVMLNGTNQYTAVCTRGKNITQCVKPF